MRSIARSAALAAALILAGTLAGTGCSSSGGGTPRPTASPACVASAGDQIVALADDRKSQNSENVVPVVAARSPVGAATSPLVTALDRVSADLSQDELLGLNRAVSLDGTDPARAARNFLERRRAAEGLSGGSGPVVVAAVDFSESRVLAAVYAAALDVAGYQATVRVFRTRETLQPALQSGEVQVTPEYAATLTTFLAAQAGRARQRPSSDIDRTLAVLRPLAEARGLRVLAPAAAANQNAFAVTKATADALRVTTVSGLVAACPAGVTFGGPPECPTRPFCQAALERTYGARVTRFVALDADGPETRRALTSGQVLVAEVFSSDADVVPASG